MKKIIAYKVFNPDWTCKGFQYKMGETYSITGAPELCKRGFHACKKVQDCFSYYSFDPSNKVAEVELSGKVLGEDGDKQCATKITLLRELSWNEMLVLANSGVGNRGHSNSGHRNSGDRNSGHWNSGHWNSGDRNSGHWNSGHWNSGHRNSGDRNSGHWNSGDRNSGDSNSGDRNSGDSNSGDRNSGHWNSGHWNSGDWNSGCFNSITPDDILVFNKPCKRTVWDNVGKPSFIFNIITNQWIRWVDMSDAEKAEEKNKSAFVTDGYLKTIPYKEAWANAYNNASKEDIELLKCLPNFDARIFEDITGIKID